MNPTSDTGLLRLTCAATLRALSLGAIASFSLAALPLSAEEASTTGDATATPAKLASLVVTATVTESNPDEIPTTISVIDSETIEELGATSVDQILEEVPGLSVEVSSGRISSPKMRGTNSQQTLILIDGRRLAPGFKRMTDLNQMLSGGIDRIEVVRGPVSSLYGSEAIGGVVNIITKKGPKNEYEGHAMTQFGANHYTDWSASVSGGAAGNGMEIYGAFSARHNTWYESGDGTPDDVDDVETTGGFINLSSELGVNTDLACGTIFSRSKRTGMRPQSGGSLRTAIDKRIGAWAELTQQIGDDTSAVLRSYAEQYNCDITMESAKSTTYSPMQNKITVLDGHVTTTMIPDLSATVGGELRRESYDDYSDDSPNDVMDNLAAFTQFVWTPLEKSCVIAGARVDRYDDFGTHTSPQISAQYDLPFGVNIHAGWSGGYRAPNSMELNVETYESAGKVVVEPNSELDPESSNTFEVGLAMPGDGWRIALTAFHTEVEDMIEEVTIATNTKQWQNLESVKIDGIELEGSVDLGRYASLDGFACWLDPRDEETGYHVEGEQRWYSRISLVGRMPAFGLMGRVSVRFGSDEWGTENSKEASNEVIDARMEKTLVKHWKVYVGARDITDTDSAHYYCGLNMDY